MSYKSGYRRIVTVAPQDGQLGQDADYPTVRDAVTAITTAGLPDAPSSTSRWAIHVLGITTETAPTLTWPDNVDLFVLPGGQVVFPVAFAGLNVTSATNVTFVGTGQRDGDIKVMGLSTTGAIRCLNGVLDLQRMCINVAGAPTAGTQCPIYAIGAARMAIVDCTFYAPGRLAGLASGFGSVSAGLIFPTTTGAGAGSISVTDSQFFGPISSAGVQGFGLWVTSDATRNPVKGHGCTMDVGAGDQCMAFRVTGGSVTAGPIVEATACKATAPGGSSAGVAHYGIFIEFAQPGSIYDGCVGQITGNNGFGINLNQGSNTTVFTNCTGFGHRVASGDGAGIRLSQTGNTQMTGCRGMLTGTSLGGDGLRIDSPVGVTIANCTGIGQSSGMGISCDTVAARSLTVIGGEYITTSTLFGTQGAINCEVTGLGQIHTIRLIGVTAFNNGNGRGLDGNNGFASTINAVVEGGTFIGAPTVNGNGIRIFGAVNVAGSKFEGMHCAAGIFSPRPLAMAASVAFGSDVNGTFDGAISPLITPPALLATTAGRTA